MASARYAQALLFGPDGRLYVPISGSDPSVTGQIRSYDPGSFRTGKAFNGGMYDLFASSTHLGEPWSLTFGKTNPATLAYGP